MGRTDDRSPGDGRQPYSDVGGPEGRHAQTHDVRREALTNPTGPDRSDEEFADDLRPSTASQELRTHEGESVMAGDNKALVSELGELSAEEMGRLTVLTEGTRLEQGGTYLDLNDRTRGPFTALGGQQATAENSFVSKKDVDHELWNRLVGAER